MDAGRPLADWRTDAPYAALAHAGRHAFAWEWLRRSPTYARLAREPSLFVAIGSDFGLLRYEPPGAPIITARPMWTSDVDPYVVCAVAHPAGGPFDARDFTSLLDSALFVAGEDGVEHWLWSDGVRQVRLDVTAGTLVAGPVSLTYQVTGFAEASRKIMAIARLLALIRTGRLVRSLFSPESRASRWALILRTYDALAAGASQHDIAQEFFGLDATTRWRTEESPYRDRVRRLVRAARRTALIPPRRWLDGSFR